MGPRVALSTVLLIAGGVLLVAIVVGNAMGSRVLSQLSTPQNLLPTPVPVVLASNSAEPAAQGWRRLSVVSVATDPGFPDPRVTPEPPPPPPTPRPTKRPTPRPAATAVDVPVYTSPPLPLPLVTDQASTQAAPSETGSPGSRTGSPQAAVTAPPTPTVQGPRGP